MIKLPQKDDPTGHTTGELLLTVRVFSKHVNQTAVQQLKK